jgi:hypothetical protein
MGSIERSAAMVKKLTLNSLGKMKGCGYASRGSPLTNGSHVVRKTATADDEWQRAPVVAARPSSGLGDIHGWRRQRRAGGGDKDAHPNL